MSALSPSKPFKSYAELAALLVSRGMELDDRLRAERKLAQVGYYRLSGFWFPCREFRRDAQGRPLLSSNGGKPVRENCFMPGTRFDAVFELYLLDKKLRQLMLDAIERIEVHVRSVIAHEVGYHDPLAYQKVEFIKPAQAKNFTDKRSGRERNIWNEWLARQNGQVSRSREDCIEWHRRNNKAMPFWVVIEAWDFGTVSKYFEILKGRYQNRICARLGIDNPKVLKEWLQELNTLRNRCAHHTRIWNQVAANPLPTLPHAYFEALELDEQARSRLYGLIVVIWYLVKSIGPNSDWLQQVAALIDTKPCLPGCHFAAMGFPDETGLPRGRFGI